MTHRAKHNSQGQSRGALGEPLWQLVRIKPSGQPRFDTCHCSPGSPVEGLKAARSTTINGAMVAVKDEGETGAIPYQCAAIPAGVK